MVESWNYMIIKQRELVWTAHILDILRFLIAKFMGANMKPIWGRQGPGGPHVGPTNFAIWVVILKVCIIETKVIFWFIEIQRNMILNVTRQTQRLGQALNSQEMPHTAMGVRCILAKHNHDISKAFYILLIWLVSLFTCYSATLCYLGLMGGVGRCYVPHTISCCPG